MIAQAAALSIGVYPVVRLALKYTGSAAAAALLAGWYLVFPWIIWNAVNDFHGADACRSPSCCSPSGSSTSTDSSRSRRSRCLRSRAVSFSDSRWQGLASGTRDITGECVSAWPSLPSARVGRPCASLWSSQRSNNGHSSRFYSRFETVGGSPSGLLATLVTDPGTIVGSSLERHQLALCATRCSSDSPPRIRKHRLGCRRSPSADGQLPLGLLVHDTANVPVHDACDRAARWRDRDRGWPGSRRASGSGRLLLRFLRQA